MNHRHMFRWTTALREELITKMYNFLNGERLVMPLVALTNLFCVDRRLVL